MQKQHRAFDHRDEMSKKLDHLMYIVLDYFTSRVDETHQSKLNGSSIQVHNIMIYNQFNEQDMLDIFKESHKLFSEVILKNQQCCMVHFIFIFFCAQHKFPILQQLFITRLILNITDKKEPISKRQRINSIFYLSSLIMRCKGIKLQVLYRSIEFILAHSWEQLNLNDGSR